MFKLVDWVDITKLDWYYLSANPNTILLLKQKQNYLVTFYH